MKIRTHRSFPTESFADLGREYSEKNRKRKPSTYVLFPAAEGGRPTGQSATQQTGQSAPRVRTGLVWGFTLVETVVATFLAGIMLTAVYSGLGAGFAMTKVTRENLRATQIILQRMEAIRLSSYQTIQNPASYPTNFTDYYSPGSTSKGVAYNVTYNWAPGPATLPPSYRSNVVLVTVGATWTSGKVQRSRSMQTYVARYGIQPYVSSN